MEERLKFLSTGEKPRKNVDAMKEVLDELKQEGLYYSANAKKDGKTTKNKKKQVESESESESEEEQKPKKKDKAGKKA